MPSSMSKMKPIANILVVDDEEDIVTIVRDGLQLNGFEVSVFTNPSEALKHFRKHSKEFCAVLSDIRMPQITGFQVAREVRNTNPAVKVILMTSFDINHSEFERVMPSTHIDDFIRKPATIAQIKSVLLKHIGQTKSLMAGSNENS